MNSNQDYSKFIQAFRQSSPYINAHRGKVFVIMLDGNALVSEHALHIVHDISLLHNLGIKVILVAGSRPQIDTALASANIDSEYQLNKRITSLEALSAIKNVSGNLRIELEAMFSHGLPNTPMHGSSARLISGNFITAKPLGVLEGFDFQFTGQVRKVDTAAIDQQLKQNNIVLLSNLAYSPTGECFNCTAEEVAAEVAKAMQADKFIVYSHKPENIELAREWMAEEALAYLETHDHPSLGSLVEVCQSGVSRCHLIDYAVDGALLLELFTTDGIGTLISQQPFETLRQASISDVGSILDLLEPLEAKGVLVKRERELLEQEIGHFVVIERDGFIISCSALYPYDNAMAEIACVVTHKDYQGGKRAQNMLKALEKQAKTQGIKNLFVLTTQSAHFFIEQGFMESSIEDLPNGKKDLYNFQRNSKVFIKQI